MDLNFYQLTLPIVGTETLITGITLLVLCLAKMPGRVYNKSGLRFFALAMLAMSVINFSENFFGIRSVSESESLALMVFAASVQLVLFLFAYLSMLDKGFVTAKRVALEVCLVVLFTTPTLCISPERHPMLFDLLFGLSIGFYVVKLVYNVYIYKRYLHKMMREIEDFTSDGSDSLLRWINSTFYIVLTIGIVSIIVPLTNYTVLAIYNTFLFFAYLYIYIEIIRNIYIFDAHLAAMKSHGRSYNDETALDSDLDSHNSAPRVFLTMDQAAFDKWLAQRYYAAPGITIDMIATQFNTTRTKFSTYLKNDKQTTFYEWIAELRIEDAKQQLIDFPEKPASEIAISVGIDDRSNFSRLFKRMVGVSPASYRTLHGAETKTSA